VTDSPEHGIVFKYDSTAGGSLVDYSSQIRSFSIDLNANIGKYHTADSKAPKTTRGGYLGTMTIEGTIDPGASSLYSILRAQKVAASDATRTFQADKPDSNTGSERSTGECHLESLTQIGMTRAGSGEVASFRAAFALNAVTFSTIA
jgi:hypothetical protein